MPEQQPVQLLLLRDAIYAERGYATVRRMFVCLSVCDFQLLWSHSLEYFENNFTAD